MMFVRSPHTHSVFEPSRFNSPSIACWVLKPGSEDEDETTVNAANKQQCDTATPSKAPESEKKTPESVRHIVLNDFDIFDEDSHFVLSTDLPGIKAADLKVEFKDGALNVEGSRKKGPKKQRFVRRLAMEEDDIDVENLMATLEDGILTVKVPKVKKTEEKEGKARKVVASKTSPPEDPVEMNMEIEMPGVKLDDLEIVLAKKGLLTVSGERKNGKSQPAKKTEAYMLNIRKVDTSKLEAYLVDGVLTIRAPAKVHKIKAVPVNGKMPVIKEAEKEEDEKKEE